MRLFERSNTRAIQVEVPVPSISLRAALPDVEQSLIGALAHLATAAEISLGDCELAIQDLKSATRFFRRLQAALLREGAR